MNTCTCGAPLAPYAAMRDNDQFDAWIAPFAADVLAASRADALAWITSARAPQHDVRHPITGEVLVSGLCQYPAERAG